MQNQTVTLCLTLDLDTSLSQFDCLSLVIVALTCPKARHY